MALLMKPSEITVELLESAYRMGVFPMGDARTNRIQWYLPELRAIFDLDDFHVPRRLAKTLRSGRFQFTVNAAFEEVMRRCSRSRLLTEHSVLPVDEIWITPDIIRIYVEMHRFGKAHSLEAWEDGRLVGGLYGVALGGAFMGESMFHEARDASKACLVKLVERLRERGFTLLDTQFATEHLAQFGLLMVSHREYQRRLRQALALEQVTFVDG